MRWVSERRESSKEKAQQTSWKSEMMCAASARSLRSFGVSNNKKIKSNLRGQRAQTQANNSRNKHQSNRMIFVFIRRTQQQENQIESDKEKRTEGILLTECTNPSSFHQTIQAKADQETYRERRVGGNCRFSTTDNLGLYRDSFGLADARMEVRAFREQTMPAFAIETVCCS